MMMNSMPIAAKSKQLSAKLHSVDRIGCEKENAKAKEEEGEEWSYR
jgi:hypothetical protein